MYQIIPISKLWIISKDSEKVVSKQVYTVLKTIFTHISTVFSRDAPLFSIWLYLTASLQIQWTQEGK